MTDQVILAFSTCQNEATARRIAETLVVERLAGCVNRIPGVRSSYMWDAELQDAEEILLIIKSTAGRLCDLERRLKELHPYDLPEFVVARVDDGNEPYLDWIRRNVRSQGDRE